MMASRSRVLLKKRRVALPMATLWLALILGAVPRPTYAASVAVVVNAATVLNTGATAGAKAGINTEYWWDNQANRVARAATLSSALSGMKMKVWRFPGGEKADGHLWSTPPYTTAAPILARISSQDWPSNDPVYWTPPGSLTGNWAHPVYTFDQFMADCQAAGCTPIVVVAYDGIYKPPYPGGVSLTFQQALDTATAWVNYSKNKGYNVKYWEIGNETWNNTYMGADPGRTQQANDLITFSRTMKAVDPTIKIGTNANTQGDFNTLLSIAAADTDFLVVHSYPAWSYRDFSSYAKASSLTTAPDVNNAYNALQGYPNDKNRIQIMVTETGGITFGIRGSWTQGDLGHALMTFELMARSVQDSRVQFTQVWNTRWINQNTSGIAWPNYPESEYDILKTDNSMTPQGLALNLIGNYTLSEMVSATPQTGKVFAFASFDPVTNKLNVFLVNKNTTATATTVTLQNYISPSTGLVNRLGGTDSTDTSPTLISKPSVSITGNQFSITLDPVSVTVVQIG